MPLTAKRVTVVEQNLAVIEQGVALIDGLSPDNFLRVGPHLRHAIEFYGCLLDGLERNQIDYDGRSRKLRLETEQAFAVETLRRVSERLDAITEEALPTPITVRLDAPAEADEGGWSRSTVHRELQFLLSHTVHHYALIGLHLEIAGIVVPSQFGVAPSTLEFRRKDAPLS